ncbi:gliding motility-associated C-terminal domain-containing protein [Bacteroidales bacterium OttesenSCG-928-I21]|nr:gliding motility-associated C-terminal domain-containing protein [Bacteroidales bacterium OttesenSCG-928-I21]
MKKFSLAYIWFILFSINAIAGFDQTNKLILKDKYTIFEYKNESDTIISEHSKYNYRIKSNPTIVADIGMVSCNGGSDGFINLRVTGGTEPYFFEWSTGNNTQNLSNISAGAYSVTVRDRTGKEAYGLYTITEPSLMELALYQENILCYGENTGSIDLVVVGGTIPYRYQWSNGTLNQDLSNIGPGLYGVTVTDNKGCEKYASTQIYQPQELTINMVPTHVRCMGEANGAIDLSINGGIQPYQIQWNNGAVSEDLHNLQPGLYEVTVTDKNNCTVSDFINITQANAPLAGTITGTHVTCNGGNNGNIYINTTGGIPPYHYEWSTGTWQQNLVGIEAGNYFVTVSDVNRCSYEMNFTITEPLPYYVMPTNDLTICYGMITEVGVAVVSGNTPPYNFHWADGVGGNYSQVRPVQPLETTVYTVTVTDANGCESTPVSVTVNVHEDLTMNISSQNELVCPGNYIFFDVEIIGGGISPNYVYVNDSLMKVPIRIYAEGDTILNFTISDACNHKNISINREIKTHPLPQIRANADITTGCSPLNVQFTESSPEIGQRYIWNFDEGDFENLSFEKNPIHVFNNQGTHHVTLIVSSEHGCRDTVEIPIHVLATPNAEFRASKTVIDLLNPTVDFTNYTTGGYWHNWDFGDGTTSTEFHTIHTFTDIGTFKVILSTISMYGCVDTTSIDIEVTYGVTFFAPTAFIPYGSVNAKNSIFNVFVSGHEPTSFTLSIFNKWGEQVFYSDNPEEGWDGKNNNKNYCMPGIYTWRAVFLDLNGNEHIKHGKVMLLN